MKTVLRCEALEHRRLMAADLAIAVDDVVGLRAAEIRLNYDASLFEVSAKKIRLGDIWQDKASLLAKVDEAEGTVNVFVFSAEPLPLASGPLVEMQFDVVNEVASDVALATIASLRLNEGAIDSQVRLVSEEVPAKPSVRPWMTPAKSALKEHSQLPWKSQSEIRTSRPESMGSTPWGKSLPIAALEHSAACQAWTVQPQDVAAVEVSPPRGLPVTVARLDAPPQARPLIASKDALAN